MTLLLRMIGKELLRRRIRRCPTSWLLPVLPALTNAMRTSLRWSLRPSMSSHDAQDPNSYAGKLLAKEPTLKVNFSRASAAVSRAKTEKVARFLPNPEANWGPKSKHTRTGKVRPWAALGDTVPHLPDCNMRHDNTVPLHATASQCSRAWLRRASRHRV